MCLYIVYLYVFVCVCAFVFLCVCVLCACVFDFVVGLNFQLFDILYFIISTRIFELYYFVCFFL